MDSRSGLREKSAAWGVHTLTLTGVVWAVLATAAILQDQPRLMWLFLGIAIIVDAADGPLARRYEVRRHTPNFDGIILDLVVDYLTWSFIPALFLFKSGLTGGPVLSTVSFILICASSMFCYANVRMKTEDNYFRGFPAAWNIVIFYLWVLQSPWWLNLAIVVVLAALTVVPITFLHPFRVRSLRAANVTAVILWLAAATALVVTFPDRPLWAEVPWWVAGVWLVVSGLIGTRAARRQERARAQAASS